MMMSDFMSPQLKQGLQTASPLLLAMGQGLSSGRGVNAYMPQGFAAMMANQERLDEEAANDKLDETLGQFGLSSSEQALLGTMDLRGKQSYLANLISERRSRANRGGGSGIDSNLWASLMGDDSPAPQTGAASMMGMNPVATTEGLSFGSPALPKPSPSEGGLSFGEPTPKTDPMERVGQIEAKMLEVSQLPPNRTTDAVLKRLESARNILLARAERSAPQEPNYQRVGGGQYIDMSNPGAGAMDIPNLAVEQPQRPTAKAADGYLRYLDGDKERVYPNAVAPSDQSSAEAEIARLTSIGVPYETAVKVGAGVFRQVTDPLTKETLVIDLTTNQPVWRGGETSEAPAPSEPTAQTEPDLTFGEQFQNAPEAFGLGSVARGAVNAVADSALGVTPFPETRQAQTDFAVFGEGLINAYASAYGRQPPSWLLRNIEQLTPKPGQVFEGPGAAQDKLMSLARDLETRRVGFVRAGKRRLSPQSRQENEGNVAGIDATLSQIYQALAQFETGQMQKTSTGVQFRILD